MKANFLSPGMMAMHFAESSKSWGMALSGVSIISLKTWAAFCVRSLSSWRSDARTIGAATRRIVEKIRRCFTMFLSSFAVSVLTRDDSSIHSPDDRHDLEMTYVLIYLPMSALGV